MDGDKSLFPFLHLQTLHAQHQSIILLETCWALFPSKRVALEGRSPFQLDVEGSNSPNSVSSYPL